jgi:DNA sulfur modification protein DndB
MMARKKLVGTLRKQFPAVEVKMGDRRFFLSSIPATVLYECSKISRAEEDPEEGFQRHLDKRRATRIAGYLDDGYLIPGAIILSAQKSAQLQFDGSAISFVPVPGAFIVIDGQHRLFGAHKATSALELPVSILNALDAEEEVQYFLDINTNQKGVPRTLQIEVEKFRADRETLDQVRHKLFHELNDRPVSPLCGRLSATKSVRGKLSHVPFKDGIDPILAWAVIRDLPYEKQVQVLINFLNAVREVLIDSVGDDSRLVNAAFFQALMMSFKDIVHEVRSARKKLTEEAFTEVVEPLKGIDWDSHKGTNKPAIQSLSRHIIDLIVEARIRSEDLL